MCGISGYLGKINFINTKKKNVKLTKIMKYRGPDGRGYYINKTKNNFFLGFFIILSINSFIVFGIVALKRAI